jgi:hypothetical protein
VLKIFLKGEGQTEPDPGDCFSTELSLSHHEVDASRWISSTGPTEQWHDLRQGPSTLAGQHAGTLIESQQQVHILDGNAAGPLDQVIGRAEDH